MDVITGMELPLPPPLPLVLGAAVVEVAFFGLAMTLRLGGASDGLALALEAVLATDALR